MTDWALRAIDPALERRWLDAGHWRDETLGQLLDRGLNEHSAQAFTVRSAVRPHRGTMGDVLERARTLARGLQDRGIGRGSVVSFQLPNWVEAAHVFYAAASLGAVVVPIVHFYGPKEVGYILKRTPPDVYVTYESFGLLSGTRTLDAAIAAGAPRPPIVAIADVDLDALHAKMPLDAPLETDPAAPALVGYTSGTTSDPKGVIHSHRTIGFEVRQLTAMQASGGSDMIVGAPVGHAIGMLAALLMPTLQGRPIHLVDVWDPGAVLRQMAEEGLSSGGGATYFLMSLLDHPDFDPAVHAPLMTHVGLGGSAVPAAVGERAEALGISTVRMYGSTEHPSITGSRHEDPREKRLMTDGRPLEGVEIRLDEDGEIWSRGPDCFVGYTDPALTANAFDDEGWYRTEDVGVLDDDGFLTITDRTKDIIIRGGENISAAEVEELLMHLPTIAECAVVAAPDLRLGEHACAFIRLRPDAEAPDLVAVREHLAAAGLAKQKWPEELIVVADLPRTASGKVQKFVLRQQLREGAIS